MYKTLVWEYDGSALLFRKPSLTAEGKDSGILYK